MIEALLNNNAKKINSNDFIIPFYRRLIRNKYCYLFTILSLIYFLYDSYNPHPIDGQKCPEPNYFKKFSLGKI